VLPPTQGYREDEGLYLESDADEQILLHVHFTSAIKLSAITIAGPDDGHGPRGVKLFINRSTLGFAEAEDETGVQEFELEDKHLKGEPVQLRHVSYTLYRSLAGLRPCLLGAGMCSSFCPATPCHLPKQALHLLFATTLCSGARMRQRAAVMDCGLLPAACV
jgi:PITH domain